ncbi:ScbA/BarX family gamma-butyrolactone biosynthesis protein [Streptomyces durbertensis]|uniref:ScbA/BarX family gamma-butyrolactone biosynthesis protein n=1 Tax=Streptomyces durbertensis TaxID=2448886 RepID=UPI002B215F96|nr:ScbA/BarX family gamma-butyrolactone biosynthesis protein [Streptomyces durbertensis]
MPTLSRPTETLAAALVESFTEPVTTGAVSASEQVRAPQARFTSTAPRELVHRAAVAEVFLTGWHRTGENRFALTAQWPRGHSFFTPVDRCYDPLLLAETIRQVGTLLAHAEYGVPLGHQFLMWDLHQSLHSGHIRVGAAPADLELAVTCHDIRRRGRRLAGMRYEVTLYRDGRATASGGASFDCTTAQVYRRMRGERAHAVQRRPLPPAVAPSSVSRLLDMDVVLSPTEAPLRWQLRADEQHPVLFDHPVDHFPGMVLVEAARQAAQAAHPDRPFLPAAMHSEFHRYAELDAPCWLSAEVLTPIGSGSRAVRVTGHQDGQAVYTSVLEAGA